MCKVDGCGRFSNRKKADLCEMHYMRVRRGGGYEKQRVRHETMTHSGGYILQYEPMHPLSQPSTGYVYQHRKAYYDNVSKAVSSCEMCGVELTWVSAHIDHINENKTDNDPVNLRPLCSKCNMQRNRKPEKERRGNVVQLTIDGVSLSITEWIEKSKIEVHRSTVIRRLKRGLSDKDALFAPKETHKKGSEV